MGDFRSGSITAVSEIFSTSAELRKAQREVSAYYRFRQLSKELLGVNERICTARPEEALSLGVCRR